ncbi:separin [Anoplophora glabripennis]|nr:separin [Anoplophora glabripennis]
MNEKHEEISRILKELQNIHYPSGIQFQRLQQYKALNDQASNELAAIYNLAQSHSPGLRNKAALRYEKFLSCDVEPMSKGPLISAKDEIAFKCPTDQIENSIRAMLEQVEQMPKEWTLIQLTSQYNPLDNINEDNNIYQTNPIHIAVFSCGQSEQSPFLVTVDAPKDAVNGNCVELAQEMMSIIKGNKEALMSHKQKVFKNHKEKLNYMSRRQSIENRLKAIIKDIQNMWLKEWRCLLSGKYTDESLDEMIKVELINFFKTEVVQLEVTTRTLFLLTYVVKGTKHLKLAEIIKAIHYCFPEITDKSLMRSITQFIRNLGDKISTSTDQKKHPVILILDETLDCFPWEMIDVLNDEPVSRVPSLQFIYTLFKEHEKDIVDGHKIVTDFDKGTYIVNPDMDLINMEIRMMNFFNYWTPNWTGTSGCQLDSTEFFELLTSSDIFSYNGHGSGSHLLSLDKIQRSRVKAVVLLFGCGSTKINRMDPQVEMYGPYHMYLIARCPCMVGMLWEVTDLDTDILTTEFMSQWIPSKAPVHWRYVDKSKWNKAEEKTADFSE